MGIILVTGFRSFVFQSLAYAYIFFTQAQQEKSAFKSEVERLTEHLSHLDQPIETEKAYKDSLIIRFKDTLLKVEVSEIAFFHLQHGIVYQYMFSRENTYNRLV